VRNAIVVTLRSTFRLLPRNEDVVELYPTCAVIANRNIARVTVMLRRLKCDLIWVHSVTLAIFCDSWPERVRPVILDQASVTKWENAQLPRRLQLV
jgi:hypothetical protein